MADLFETPQPTDIGLLCTNLRLLNGKRPVFADHIHSTFFFPYQFVRFVEIHPVPSDLPAVVEPAPAAPAEDELEGDIEIDEDFLRRIREV